MSVKQALHASLGLASLAWKTEQLAIRPWGWLLGGFGKAGGRNQCFSVAQPFADTASPALRDRLRDTRSADRGTSFAHKETETQNR